MKLFVLMLACAIPCFAIQPVEEGPIHEAFVTPTAGNIILEAVSEAPPEKIDEIAPAKIDQSTEWIEGYWAWSPEQDGYIWMSGVYRKSPPNHHWVSGSWEKMSEGWVWIPGFWTKNTTVEHINKMPPDPVEESVSTPPANSFWMPGYWNYEGGDFSWLDGRWEQFDANWVYVPAHYTWQPDGYVFIDAYWDYPLDKRGTAYSPVVIEGEESYLPNIVLSPDTIVVRLFPYYPNYLCFYNHHYHFHTSWWGGFWGTPPWWGWDLWWSFPWQNQWGLFWWWGHPGFPHPMWLNANMAQQIAPPGNQLLKRMENVKPPFIVTPKGVVPPRKVAKALKKNRPVVPANNRRYLRIQRKVQPNISDREDAFRPTGTGRPGRAPATRGVQPPSKPGRARPPIRRADTPRDDMHIMPSPTQVQPRQTTPRRVGPPVTEPARRAPGRVMQPPSKPRATTPPVRQTQPRPSQVQPRPRPSQVQPRPRPSQVQPRPRPSEIQPSSTPRMTPPARPTPRQVQPTRPRPSRPSPSRSVPQRTMQPPRSSQTQPRPSRPSETQPSSTPRMTPPARPTPRQVQPARPRPSRPSEIQPSPRRSVPQRTMQPPRSSQTQPRQTRTSPRPTRTQPSQTQPSRVRPRPGRGGSGSTLM